MTTLFRKNSSYKIFNWLHSKGYLQGVFWAVIVCFISSLNDIFIKLSGSCMGFLQIAFFRFLFATLTLLPVMFYNGLQSFKTTRPLFHSLRAIFGYGAISCWCAGVVVTPLAVTSTLAQTIPLFVLPMAFLILREKIGWQRTIATLIGFVGIIVTLQGLDQPLLKSIESLNLGTIWLLIAAILFAASDILNKVMVANESPLTMLFYFAIGTTLIGFYPALMVWETPRWDEIFWLICLGAGSNLILYCLLKSFAATDISALQPYRYVELFFAGGLGFLIFGEIPTIMTLIGAAIIVPSTLTIAIYETRKQKKED